MTRPLRLEFPGALYHVTSRGDRKGKIFLDDSDRHAWLEMLATVCTRFNFVIHAYCQMTNHYHLVVETIDGDLSRGLRQLNGAYSQLFNRRHRLVGHVFQGRYKAILVQKESYLLELARYVVLNPVRAGIVLGPLDWPWSSHRHMMRQTDKPNWLETDWLLHHFGQDLTRAPAAYADFVAAGAGALSPLRDVKHQMVLGEKEFIAQHLNGLAAPEVTDVIRAQRRGSVLSLGDLEGTYSDRGEAMARAYWTMAFSMQEIASHFCVSVRTVGRAVKKFKIATKVGREGSPMSDYRT
jgi:putative transposase